MRRILITLLLLGSTAYALSPSNGGNFSSNQGNSTFVSGQPGNLVFGVRNDNDAATANSNLTYGPVSLDSTGKIKVTGTLTSGGASVVTKIRKDYLAGSVVTSAYTQLVASVASTVAEIEIFDSSGETMVIAFGGPGSEVDQINIFPGGNGKVPLNIVSGTRVSVKAVSHAASTGELDINFYDK